MEKLERPYTRLDNEIMGAVVRSPFTPSEKQVCFAVIRLTFGYHKREAPISHGDLEHMLKLSRSQVKYALGNLKAKNVIQIKRRRCTSKNYLSNVLSINQDTSRWVIRAVSYAWAQSRQRAYTRKFGHERPAAEAGGVGQNLFAGGVGQNQGGVGLCSDPLRKERRILKPPIIPLEEKGDEEKGSVYDSVIQYWNDNSSLPPCLGTSPERKRRLEKRLREPIFQERWREAINKVASSHYLSGKTKPFFRASLDWLIKNGTNYLKVLEGQFTDDEERGEQMDTEAYKKIERLRREKEEQNRLEEEKILLQIKEDNYGIFLMHMRRLGRCQEGVLLPDPQAPIENNLTWLTTVAPDSQFHYDATGNIIYSGAGRGY